MTGSTPAAPGAAAAAVHARLVPITIPGGEAPALARTWLVEGRAAGVNRPPRVRSTYSRAGCIDETEEAVRMLKTTAAGDPALGRPVREPDPSDVPGVPALPGALGAGPCLDPLSRPVTAA
jgi:uncharacterized protein involved in tolerance to divalent cations